MAKLPWQLRNRAAEAASTLRYCGNRIANALRAARPGSRPTVLFCVPFYGYTGGAFAVLSVANLLSESCNVSFLTKPSNVMNKYVSRKVRMVGGIAGDYDFCVIESGIDDAAVAKMKRGGARIILVMHGAPSAADGTSNHGYTDKQIQNALGYADSVQYISDVQTSFLEAFPSVHRRKIPNYVMQAGAAKRAPVVGVVCDTTLPHKNVEACIRAAELSAADRIEIWGKYQDRRSTARVRWNGFTNNKRRIYGSFSVLVHLSRLENQPLVILDAMSAGIPCVLAPLPVYEIFRGVKGIFFADADDPVAVSKAINVALACPQDVREGLVRVWNENYSPHKVRSLWMSYLGDVGRLKGA